MEITFAKALGLDHVEPGQDLYKLKASQMFNVSYSEVTPEQRLAAKRAAYLNIYRPAPFDVRKPKE